MSKKHTEEQMRQNIYEDLSAPIMDFLTSRSASILCAILYGGYKKHEAVELVDGVVKQLNAEYDEYKQAEYKYLGNSKGEK